MIDPEDTKGRNAARKDGLTAGLENSPNISINRHLFTLYQRKPSFSGFLLIRSFVH